MEVWVRVAYLVERLPVILVRLVAPPNQVVLDAGEELVRSLAHLQPPDPEETETRVLLRHVPLVLLLLVLAQFYYGVGIRVLLLRAGEEQHLQREVGLQLPLEPLRDHVLHRLVDQPLDVLRLVHAGHHERQRRVLSGLEFVDLM